MAGRIHTKGFVRQMRQARFMSGPRVHSFRFLIIKYKHISFMTCRGTSIINNYISRYNQWIFFQKIKFILTSYNMNAKFYSVNWKENDLYTLCINITKWRLIWDMLPNLQQVIGLYQTSEWIHIKFIFRIQCHAPTNTTAPKPSSSINI
jgi:hypothetical protein